MSDNGVDMNLKDGKLLIFSGTNWKLAGDKKWVEHTVPYLANGNEKYVGERIIDGAPHAVFKLCDDDFGAQLKSIATNASAPSVKD
jgi:hypothetical protein